MMATPARSASAARDRSSRRYTLDGVQYDVEYWWDAELSRWQVSVTRPGTDFAVRGLFLNPGAPLFLSADPLAPAGRLLCDGRDPYLRSDLGTDRCRLLYVEATP